MSIEISVKTSCMMRLESKEKGTTRGDMISFSAKLVFFRKSHFSQLVFLLRRALEGLS